MNPLSALRGVKTFRHGIHPDEMKGLTSGLAIERMPFVEEYVLPLAQHTGRPARPIVLSGDRIIRGQMVAAPDGYISTAIHAPVTGTVAAIELRPHPGGQRTPSLVLRADPFSSQQIEPDGEPPSLSMPRESLLERIQRSGLVGLGGAAFPSHVKLNVPEGKKAHWVIINGCECEPYLTCDHRLMLERAAAVVEGARLIRQLVGAERVYIGVELNKLDAIETLREAAAGDDAVEVVPLEVKYPQGAEKMLIESIFRREVPSGKLPLDLEMVVHNVGTAAALADLFRAGTPLIERVVTVTGPGVTRPANLMVPLGTPLRALLDHCGGLRPGTRQVIVGGPMMGMAQKDLDVPVIKGTSGVLALTEPVGAVREEPCIRCGRCLEACPMYLNPSRLALLVRNEDGKELDGLHMMDCCECASCSFSCPSNIPLVQVMRIGKALVRQYKAKAHRG